MIDARRQKANPMPTKQRRSLIFIMGLLLLLGSAVAMAAEQGLPPRPPAPTSTPTPPSIRGAFLLLETTPSIPGRLSDLQWQDVFGGWHDVNGWRGETEPDGTKLWWVAPRDMGTGPFRWRLYDLDGEEVIAVSPAFHLPEATGATIVVEILTVP